MENETQDVDLNNEEALDQEEAETTEETTEEAPKEKRQFTPEEQLAIYERKAKQLRKKLGTDSDEPKADTKDKATKSELDYGQKAYLVASGIKGSEETALVTEFMANTGKSLDEVVESKFFQAELKELRDSKASSDAIPKGSKRSGQSPKDSVDYWLAKDELPENTPENQELRRKIVNERYKRETSSSKFATNMSGNIVRQSQLKK